MIYKIEHITNKAKLIDKVNTKKYLTIHGTGNQKATAQNERDYLNSISNTSSTGFHVVVDDKQAIECIPFNRVAYHAGDGGEGKGNNQSIGLEICESGNRNLTLYNAVQVSAKILKEENIPIENMKRHFDWSGKNCPRILSANDWQGWNEFKKEVEKELNKSNVKNDTLYRVQVGAYSIKENAEKLLQELKSKGFQGVITETSVTAPPIPPKEEINIKSKYYKIGDAHIIETTPDNIYVKILGDTLDKSVGVNGVLFDTQTAPVTSPESCVFIAMNDGKPLSNNSQFNGWNSPPRATLIYHTNKKLGFRQLKNISTIKDNTIWAVGGFMVKPYMDFKNEQIPPGVNYKTAHTYIGYDKEGKIYLIIKPNHNISEIVPLMDKLKITNAIVLDGGGSSQMNHPDGQYKSTRKINSAILLKEI